MPFTWHLTTIATLQVRNDPLDASSLRKVGTGSRRVPDLLLFFLFSLCVPRRRLGSTSTRDSTPSDDGSHGRDSRRDHPRLPDPPRFSVIVVQLEQLVAFGLQSCDSPQPVRSFSSTPSTHSRALPVRLTRVASSRKVPPSPYPAKRGSRGILGRERGGRTRPSSALNIEDFISIRWRQV
ncbi:hypothetical protein BDY24DRAFT_402268 [Mrakia frigida]|uniref:uncharacterized protein n=1 Tax=Mrakia frigida TaxID=29902 RepID=UPI003FCC1455